MVHWIESLFHNLLYGREPETLLKKHPVADCHGCSGTGWINHPYEDISEPCNCTPPPSKVTHEAIVETMPLLGNPTTIQRDYCPVFADCPRCGGSGFTNIKETIVCDHCWGEGRVEVTSKDVETTPCGRKPKNINQSEEFKGFM